MRTKEELRAIMRDAWMLVKTTGASISAALKQSWALFKLRLKMHQGIVKFHFVKISGEAREAFGTLKKELINYELKGSDRKVCESLFTYFDTEKQAYRSFKKWNLVIDNN